MMYLTYLANLGQSVTTLRGRAAAINRIHLEAGEAPPGADPSLRLFWKGLARTLPPPRATQITALRIAGLREICRAIDANAIDPVELRDRAILGLFGAGATSSEIANLRWSLVESRGTATAITLRGHRQRLATRELTLLPRVDDQAAGPTADCPVHALNAWRHHLLGQGDGLASPVFCHLDPRCGQGDPLDGKTIAAIRLQRLRTLGELPGKHASLEKAMSLLGHRHPIDLRDKAMLTLGFAGAMRRGEVTNLRWSDLKLTEGGLVCRLRRTKTNMEGVRQTHVGIPFGRSAITCPVTAVLAWRARVEAQFGELDPEAWVFTTAGRRGRAEAIGREPIKRETLTRVVSSRARQAGLPGHWGGRSLRAGFISTAADLDIPLEAIATQSRHKTLDNLAVYIRNTDPFRRNPAARVGL